MKLGSDRLLAVGCATVVGVLYAAPLLLSGRPYIDDLIRSVTGQTAWAINARPLADILMIILNTGYPMANLAPLTQIGAVALLCVACVALFEWTAGMAMPTLWRALACMSLLLNPFLLQNNAYQFDSLPMAVAFLACVWAAKPGTEQWIFRTLRCAGFVFVGLSLYQSAANVTVALAFLLVVVETLRGDAAREILTGIATRLGGFALGTVAYTVTIGALLIGGSYTPEHSSHVALTADGLQRVLVNFSRATHFISESFDTFQWWLLAAAALLALASAVIFVIARLQRDRKAWPLVVACLVAMAGLWLTPLGISAALQDPVLQPRVLMAFGVVLAFVLLFAAEGLFRLRARFAGPLSSGLISFGLFAAVVMPLVICLTIAYAFGSAQSAQDGADRALVADIRTGLNDLEVHEPFYLAVDGRQPLATAAATSVMRFPLLKSLVPTYFRKGWFWSAQYLRYHDLPARFDAKRSETAIAKAKNRDPDYEGIGFDLTVVGPNVVLRFPR